MIAWRKHFNWKALEFSIFSKLMSSHLCPAGGVLKTLEQTFFRENQFKSFLFLISSTFLNIEKLV